MFFIKKFTAPPASLQIAHKTDCKSRTIISKNQGVNTKSLVTEVFSLELAVSVLQIFPTRSVNTNLSEESFHDRKQSFLFRPEIKFSSTSLSVLLANIWKAIAVRPHLGSVPLMLLPMEKPAFANIGFNWQQNCFN